MMWWRVPRFLFAKSAIEEEEVGCFLQGPVVVVVVVVVRGACAEGVVVVVVVGYVPTSASNRKLR